MGLSPPRFAPSRSRCLHPAHRVILLLCSSPRPDAQATPGAGHTWAHRGTAGLLLSGLSSPGQDVFPRLGQSQDRLRRPGLPPGHGSSGSRRTRVPRAPSPAPLEGAGRLQRGPGRAGEAWGPGSGLRSYKSDKGCSSETPTSTCLLPILLFPPSTLPEPSNPLSFIWLPRWKL